MALEFEVGTGAVVGDDDLLFDGMDGKKRIRFVLSEEAMMDLAKTHDDLTHQQKFSIYDRHRDHIHEVAMKIYSTVGAGKNDVIVIRSVDLNG